MEPDRIAQIVTNTAQTAKAIGHAQGLEAGFSRGALFTTVAALGVNLLLAHRSSQLKAQARAAQQAQIANVPRLPVNTYL